MINPPSGAAVMLSGPDLASEVTVMAKAETEQNNAGRKTAAAIRRVMTFSPL